MGRYIAIDVGAESGRVIIGDLTDGKLTLETVHRFPNGGVEVNGHVYWDALNIFREIKVGLGKVAVEYGSELSGLAVDTWGVDFALLDNDDNLLSNPHAYRDPQTNGMLDAVFDIVPKREVFEATAGIQTLAINTLFHLYAIRQRNRGLLELAQTFLMMPDLLSFWLTGEKRVEYTNATTTQFFDSRSRRWTHGILDKLGVPGHFFGAPIVLPGQQIGRLSDSICAETGLSPLPVYAVASHDTASAIAGVPAAEDDFAWLSSGTWSLLGGTATEAIVSDEALQYNFSSYGSANGGVMPWKNIMGLWLVQECRRRWMRAGEVLDYDQLTELARGAEPFKAVIDPDDPAFLAPADMPAAIQDYCGGSGQTVPTTRGEILRTALESLALRYRWVVEKLERLLGRAHPCLYVVGGGSQNDLLNQLTADALNRPVLAGPVEATAMGNLLVQAVANGELQSFSMARDVARSSVRVRTFEPMAPIGWNDAYRKFKSTLSP